MVSRQVQSAIQHQSAEYGVPLWIVEPLVMAESGGNPNARNGPAVGLLQITPNFPGASGQTLTDPVVNLDVGLTQISNYLRKHPEDLHKSLQSYEDVISNTGWDTTLGWAHEGEGEPNTSPDVVKRHYINAYVQYGGGNFGSSGGGVDIGGAVGGAVGSLGNAAGATGGALDAAGNVIGGALGAVGTATQKEAGQTACDAFATLPGGGLFAPVLCGLMGEAMDPRKAILILVAFLVLVAAAWHLLDKGSSTVLQVQSSAGRMGRAGGAIKKGAGAVARLGEVAAV